MCVCWGRVRVRMCVWVRMRVPVRARVCVCVCICVCICKEPYGTCFFSLWEYIVIGVYTTYPLYFLKLPSRFNHINEKKARAHMSASVRIRIEKS